MAANLGHVRDWATHLATTAGLTAERREDVVFVVNELVTNSVEHGHGQARLRGWRTDTALVVQTDNAGRLPDPLIGRHPAAPHQRRGRGLLMTNMVADLVRIHTTTDHVTIRTYFDR